MSTTVKCPYCAEEIQAEAMKCKHCSSWVKPQADGGPWAPAGWAEGSPGASGGTPMAPLGSRRLLRSSSRRMLAGVCGGLANYLGIDVTIIRVLYVVIGFFTGIFPGLIAYVILALVIPADDDPAARMV